LKKCGVALIAVHGRTLQCARNGPADWDAIAAVVPALSTTLAIGINI